MKIVKPLRLGVLTRTFEDGSKCRLVVSLFVFVPFDDPTRLLPEVSMWKLAAEVLGPTEVLDEAMPKAAGEVLVSGKAFPKGGPAPSTYVRLKMAGIDKTLYVFGDRRWKLGVQTEPLPFAEMPVTWENAFGGAGFAPNPNGKGVGYVKTGTAEVQPLPNVEDPRRLVKSPQDRPEPAGFGALSVDAPARLAHAGTYDEAWLTHKYPGHPEDFHWSFYSVAPEDQRIEGFFQGGEHFEIHNMHPEKPVTSGELPALVARAFVTRRGGPPLDLREVTTKLDTVRLFPNQERAALVFRGVIEVEEDDADDVGCLVAAIEAKGQTKPLEHYKRALEERLDHDKSVYAALRDRDFLPDLPKAEQLHADDSLGDMETLLSRDDLLIQNVHRGAKRRLEEARREVRRRGINPALLGPDPELPAKRKFSLDEVPDVIEAALGEAEVAKKTAEERRATMMAEARAQCERHGIDFDAMVERAKKDQRPPRRFARAELERLQALQKLAENSGVDLPEVRARLADPNLEKSLVEAEAQMHELHRRFGHLLPPDDPEANAALREEIAAGVQKGQTFAGRDFSGVDLEGLDLSGADLEGVFLEAANLRNCRLDGANLRNAILVRADLEGATFDKTILAGANLGCTSLRNANLAKLDLRGVVLVRADLRGASLEKALLDEADLSESTFEDCNFSGISLKDGIVLNPTLRRVSLAGANLTKTIFVRATLDDVDFSRGTLVSTVFLGTNGSQVRFSGARLDNARFVDASSFPRADFRGASLVGANLRGTSLAEADFSGATMTSADFSACDLERANMARISANDARFVRTNLRGADLTDADLVQAIMQKARVDGAMFRGANLFRADLAKMRGDAATSFSGAFVKRARFIDQARRSS